MIKVRICYIDSGTGCEDSADVEVVKFRGQAVMDALFANWCERAKVTRNDLLGTSGAELQACIFNRRSDTMALILRVPQIAFFGEVLITALAYQIEG